MYHFTYHLASLGCRLNSAEMTHLAHQLNQAGGCPNSTHPNLVVLNTCAVTSKAEKKSRQTLRSLRKTYPNSILVATGCASDLWLKNHNRSYQNWGVNQIFGNTDKDTQSQKFLKLLSLSASRQKTRPTAPPPTHPKVKRFIKVQDGCDQHCSYCLITHTRHHSRSRPLNEILTEIKLAERQGVKEIILTGVDIADYRLAPPPAFTPPTPKTISTDFILLLTQILEETSIPRIRLGSINPVTFPPKFLKLWRNPRLMPHFHLALQSGADSVLKRMNRPYTTAQFTQIVNTCRQQIPDVLFTTDIIVGFPGETESEFKHTVAYIKRIQFSKLHVFPFSARPQTPAYQALKSGVWQPIPPQIIKKRAEKLRKLSHRLQAHYLKLYQETDLNPLWENQKNHLKFGYTKNYLPLCQPT